MAQTILIGEVFITVVVVLRLLEVERERYIVIVWAVSETAASVLHVPDPLEDCVAVVELRDV